MCPLVREFKKHPSDLKTLVCVTGQHREMLHQVLDIFDVKPDYYVKVNYNAIIKLVDALDGVDVESEYDFRSYEFHHPFKKGMNHVDGKLALDFVRTRKAFLQGDRVRGENQQRMIQAIFKKVSSPSILIKYDSILKSLEGNFVTNISTNSIVSLVNMQLDKMPSWTFNTFSLNGGDNYVLTPSGQNMYVMVPNEETVGEAIKLIDDLFKNEWTAIIVHSFFAILITNNFFNYYKVDSVHFLM